ncbi:hypothetical protein [Thalassotalea insulae]|nr:hypothetical protein [Thalassotalea insulae]
MMKIWKLCALLYIPLSGVSFAQSDIEIALTNLGDCLNEIATKELESGKSNPVLATALLTSVYKNIGHDEGSIKNVEDKYLKLYRKANDSCTKQIAEVKRLLKEKS